MDLFGIGFLLAITLSLVGVFLIWVRAFQKSIGWGFAVIFMPVMLLVFVGLNWGRTWKFFVLYLVSAGIGGNLFFHSPILVGACVRAIPEFAAVAKQIDPAAYAESQRSGPTPDKGPGAAPTPHEVRDLAETEATPPLVDPNAAPRAAYLKHAKELTAAYQELNTERLKLKPKSPGVAAFNAKAARYQHDLQTLADEKSRLDVLDHASNANAEAVAALASLRASADASDYAAFAATLKKSLSDYRQTPAFPGIVAFARPALQQATPDRVLAGLQGKGAAAARTDFDRTTRQVQAIVNQIPPMVPKPAAGADVYHYSYHPGANPPDYNAENLLATREIWKGEYAYLEAVPNVYYRSADCEFNPQTKYFYTSRTVPKKKLSDAEYAELTRLFHLLGQQQNAVANVPPPAAEAQQVSAELAALRAQLDGYAQK